ncbi:MAG: sulfotransferase [Woeseiaceae bacterium]|nr:sulfotransferase [Woeseiaceae bacterium]
MSGRVTTLPCCISARTGRKRRSSNQTRALAAEPGNPDFRKLRAAILLRLMRFDESIGVCERLLDEDPAQPTVWTSLGHLLKTVGQRDDAIAAYRRAIALEPRHGEPYWSLANLKTASVTDDELTGMRAQLEKSEVGKTDRLHFHFAMGRALEDRTRYAESFEHYAKGNELRLEQHPWDPDVMSTFVEQCRAFFTPEFFARLGDAGSSAADPIFVLGLPRSGSTLVEQILASHPAVEGTSELNDMPAHHRVARPARSQWPYPRLSGRAGRAGQGSVRRTRRDLSCVLARAPDCRNAVLHRQETQ